MQRWLLAALPPTLLLASARGALAETIQAATCDQPAVQSAIDQAQDGDTVIVPAGVCTWTTGVDFCKSITVQGAGIGATTIVDNTPDANTTWNEVPFWIEGCDNKSLRISGFTFRDSGALEYFGFITVWTTATNLRFRFDHLRVEDIKTRAFWINGGTSYGVIDHCEVLRKGSNTSQSFILKDADVHGSWLQPMSYGTAQAVFLEDNVFDYDNLGAVTDCENGGRYVFRHNKVRNGFTGNHGLDSVQRSCLQMEIYANEFLGDSPSTNWTNMSSRGGSAVFFDNIITGSCNRPLLVTNYRSCCYAGAICQPGSDPPFGDCNGTNPLDGNTEPQSEYKGWPCKDQIGRGTSQGSFPVYEWNNTHNGEDVDIYVHNGWEGCVDPQPSTHVKEGRDYFNDTPMPGYSPYAYPHPLAAGDAAASAPDAPSADGAASGPGASAQESEEGGCGCSVPGRSAGGTGVLWGLWLVAAVAGRRRRERTLLRVRGAAESIER